MTILTILGVLTMLTIFDIVNVSLLTELQRHIIIRVFVFDMVGMQHGKIGKTSLDAGGDDGEILESTSRRQRGEPEYPFPCFALIFRVTFDIALISYRVICLI